MYHVWCCNMFSDDASKLVYCFISYDFLMAGLLSGRKWKNCVIVGDSGRRLLRQQAILGDISVGLNLLLEELHIFHSVGVDSVLDLRHMTLLKIVLSFHLLLFHCLLPDLIFLRLR